MTKAEKMAEEWWNGLRITNLPDVSEVRLLIRQVVERTREEDDKRKTANWVYRRWEDEEA